MARARRFRLLPDGPLGWTPYAWLVYLITFLVEPILRIRAGVASAGYIAAMAIGLIVFLAAYFRGYWLRGRNLTPIIVMIAVMAVAYSPFNVGATVLFVYAGAFAGFLHPQRRALLSLVLVTLAGAITAALIQAPLFFWITAVPITLLVGGVNLHFAQQSRAQHRLRMAQDEIEHLATVAERERIARDLHDVLGHTLSMIVLKSELAAKLAGRDPERAAAEIRDVESAARRTLQEVREAIRGYRPTLEDEVRRAGAMLRAAGIAATYEFEDVALAQAAEETLALSLREAVTNVVRHSGAASCRIRMAAEDEVVRMDVIDDGHGAPAPEGVGLRGMRDRVQAGGGTLERLAGKGTHLRITLPIGRPPPAPAAMTQSAS